MRFNISGKLKLYCVLALSLLAIYIWFILEIGRITPSFFVAYCGDIAIITLPFWFIKRRWWLTLIPVWGMAIFFLANLLNYRFWGDLLSFSAVTMAGNVGGLLIKSVVGLLKFSDIVYLLIPVAYTIYLTRIQRSLASYNIKPIWPVVFSVALFILGQVAITRSYTRWKKITENIPCGTFFEETKERIYPLSTRINYLKSNSLIIYIIKNCILFAEDLQGTKKLTVEESNEIANYIKKFNHSEFADSFADNQSKNLIIIVVESLNAEIINKKINDREITPTMNALINSEGSISTLNMISQIKDGGSSDGQMLINTGLLPLKDGAAAMRFGSKNIYPSIVKELGSPVSIAVFGDDGTVWNQIGAFESYGFDSILCSRDFISPVEQRGRDGAMFDLALDKVRNLDGSFILECITNSMHIPFNEPCADIPEEFADADISEVEKKYYSVTNYFDCELGNFLEKVYRISPKENTIVIITSDHCQGITTCSSLYNEEDAEIPIVFIAANTGHTARLNQVSGQVNVYPTLLDIMGIKESLFSYRGLGSSLLSPTLQGAVDVFYNEHGHPDSDAVQALEISNNILKSNYFSK